MGKAYRKNIKNQYGKPDVTARDTISLGGVVAPGTAALTDAQGISAQPAARAARLEGASIIISSGLATGSIGVALRVDGATAASGTLIVGGNLYLDLVLDKEDDEEITLATGDNVRVIYNATGVGGAPGLSARVYESLLE